MRWHTLCKAEDMFIRKPTRLRHFDYVGEYRYLFTLCTEDRRRVFLDPAVVEPTLLDFVRSAEAEQIAMAAYCFMPDHLHVLAIGLTEASDARRFVGSAKQRSGYRHARDQQQKLWQRSAWDRVLRSDEDTQTVLRYVLMNPVRAGLVGEPLEYPHSGSMVWSRTCLAEILKDGR